MSKVKINQKEYDCHSYSDKDIEIGHSIEMILEGDFKPLESNRIVVESRGNKFNARLAYYHNQEGLAKLGIFVEGDV
jgi:hypothetical protein